MLNCVSPADNYSLLHDGFVNRFEINKSIWPVINKIKSICKVGLLTNMYVNMYEAIKDRGIFPSVLWDVVIDSSKVGLEKPNKEIFIYAQQKAGCNGNEILFVENSIEYINVASSLGWHAFLYDSAHPNESSRKLLKIPIINRSG